MVHKVLSKDSIVVAGKDMLSSDLAGEVVILNLTEAKYYGLEAVGAQVWQMMQEPVSVEHIRNTILDEYDVAPEQLDSELMSLLQHLHEKGLIEVKEKINL